MRDPLLDDWDRLWGTGIGFSIFGIDFGCMSLPEWFGNSLSGFESENETEICNTDAVNKPVRIDREQNNRTRRFVFILRW